MEKRESSLCICPPAEIKVHAEIWFEVFVTRFGWSPRKRFKPRSLPSAPNPSCLVLGVANSMKLEQVGGFEFPFVNLKGGRASVY